MTRASARFVLAHGFTQTARSWQRIESLLVDGAPNVSTVAVDLPGHGSASRLRRDLWGAADHLAGAGGTGTYVGYSMGGRIALHTTLRYPDLVDRLVLIGATAGIDDETGRAERRVADNVLADRIIASSLPVFIDTWLENPLFAGLSDETAQRDDRLRNTRAGLASSLRLCGTGTQEPLWDQLGAIRCPTMVIAGDQDAKFREIGERLEAAIPNARLSVVAKAGHSVHLEQPEATARAILDFVRG